MGQSIATAPPAASPPLDQQAAEAFAERIGGIIDSAAVALMLSIGHRSGLLRTLAALPPSRAEEVARAAGLAERYVREWLSAMTVSGIVTYDPVERRFALPPEHAACLQPDAPLGNLAVYAQIVPMGGAIEDRILRCFETGEGTGYDDYPHFHEVMAEDSGQTVVAHLFDTVLPLVEGLEARLEQGIAVLDAGCGAGRALLALAGRFPASGFVGYDLCPDAISAASDAARAAGLDNLRFEVRDLSGFDERERYDLVTSFDAVHDQKDPQALLRAIHRALKPGGVHLMQDIAGSAKLENNIGFPFAAFLYTVSCLHCMPVSLGQGGQGLGTMWGWETAQAMLKEAGYASVERVVLEHDPMNVWFVSRKG